MADSHVDNYPDNRSEEQRAGDNRPQAQSAILAGLRQQVAKRSSQRTSKDIDQPKAKDRVELKKEIAQAQRCNDHAE